MNNPFFINMLQATIHFIYIVKNKYNFPTLSLPRSLYLWFWEKLMETFREEREMGKVVNICCMIQNGVYHLTGLLTRFCITIIFKLQTLLYYIFLSSNTRTNNYFINISLLVVFFFVAKYFNFSYIICLYSFAQLCNEKCLIGIFSM